jgi:hypothetical protein
MLGKLFNRNKNYSKNNKFEVLIIGENETDFQEMLGITDERREELMKIAFDTYKSEELFTSTCKLAVANCTHINEVVFMMSLLCRIREYGNNPLIDILSQMVDGE